MSEKLLMKGNEAVAEAAIKAGCRYFFGYPITPQNDIPEYMSRRMPEVGGEYLQAESEVAAINMVHGAAGAGARVMTSSSSPGISLKAEGISYLVGSQLPSVIVNMMRGGPGLGGIQPSQSDYFQATKGLAHGDIKLGVLAPYSVQELVDLTYVAFEMADKYRNPMMILGDGMIGQMMEPVEFEEEIDPDNLPRKEWATDGTSGRDRNKITSLSLDASVLEDLNIKIQEKYSRMREEEVRYDEYKTEDADIILVAFGTTARICISAIDKVREEEGIRAGLFRPVTLFPYPEDRLEELSHDAEEFLTVEMNAGQMLEDVKRIAGKRRPVEFYGRCGGVIPGIEEIADKIKEMRGE
ncbi:3-methyl-2-oxobutanoate dehydrogenase subunit VorB [Halarsenatibacter silvermanii]|uniref:2-oxoglutarate ferredoxin oxidoreductase subunit alpha n=1 Tax=Halarsenatibacter silvermanii TaxID=321763 RepID=A0A1G9PL59_9FIRM|nr:3-methyl-2-oxobutanoate dehydrogenase subunit VorB [Halarsenatibacter silvermanii]SDL98947.1 2-oxoglutarate ferredoxin oxidoreductase subunit alpha [Halarsenatibacter silvermanii]